MEQNSFNRQYGKTTYMIKQAIECAKSNPNTEIRIFGHISVWRKLTELLTINREIHNITFIEKAVLTIKDFEQYRISFDNDFIDHHLLETTCSTRNWEIFDNHEQIKKLQHDLITCGNIIKTFKENLNKIMNY